MFTADTFIDAVQTGKKFFVTTFVINETVKDAMIDFIDAQADYTKKAFNSSTDVATKIASEVVAQTQEVAKFDWVQAGRDFVKAFTPAEAKE
jgi:flagellar biosynthesis protein FlhB